MTLCSCGGGAVSFSGILPEERELGGLPPWNAHIHLPFLVGSWESLWGSMLRPLDGDGRKQKEMATQMDSQCCYSLPWQWIIRA